MSKSQYADQPKPDHHAPHGSHFEVPQDHEIDFELRFRPSGIDKPLAATLDAEPVPDQQTSRALHLIPLSILSWRVKAGESGTLEQRWVSPIDIDVPLVSIRAGRRIRGASISVDGKRVFDIPDWDPHWQQTWEIPNLRMSKGMQVVATFKVDNSEENPRNPEPPPEISNSEDEPEHSEFGFTPQQLTLLIKARFSRSTEASLRPSSPNLFRRRGKSSRVQKLRLKYWPVCGGHKVEQQLAEECRS